LIVGAVSCEKSPEPRKTVPARTATHTNQQVFQVKGVVMAVKPETKEITIKHEEVPGYMEAMTMPFDVKSTNELAGIAPGDAVSFRMIVTDTEGWIDQIKKIGTAPTNNPAALSNPLAGQAAADKIRI